MAKAVTRTGKDQDGDITKLCGSWGSVQKWVAISQIEAVEAVGNEAPFQSGGFDIIVVKDPSVSGGKYLRTKAGGGESNNLDNLPDC